MNKGSLFVICAPSGTGKTSLVKALLASDDKLQVAISHTTRETRSGEIEGQDYFFVGVDQFQQMQQQGSFLEYAMVYGNLYGSSKTEVTRRLKAGYDVILEIDWQGASQIVSVMPEAVLIGIVPPSIQALKQRLYDRGKDSIEVIEQRMEKAREEIKQQMTSHFDYLIVNQLFDQALEQLQTIISASRLRADINRDRLTRLLH